VNGMANQQGAQRGLRELALFAGAGGGILGGKLLGWRTVCAVEYEPYPGCVLVARQNDGTLAPFPIWDDVRTFDGRPWRGGVDVVSGGFPCQDISCAGKGAGLDGARSGLWVEMARIIREVRPRYVFVENSPMLTSRGLGVVLGDLAALGFDAEWGVLGADDVGAPHIRKRIWVAGHDSNAGQDGRSRAHVEVPNYDSSSCGHVPNFVGAGRRLKGPTVVPSTRGTEGPATADGGELADTAGTRCERAGQSSSQQDKHPSHGFSRVGCDASMADSYCEGLEVREGESTDDGSEQPTVERGRVSPGVFRDADQGDVGPKPVENTGRNSGGSWWTSEPHLGRVADGVAARAHRLRAIGNGQVPAVAALAWRLLTTRGGWS